MDRALLLTGSGYRSLSFLDLQVQIQFDPAFSFKDYNKQDLVYLDASYTNSICLLYWL